MADAPAEHDPPERRDNDAPQPATGKARARGVLDPILSADGGLASAHASADEEAPEPRTGDRWAHRRGEPRMLALFWSIYLFGAAISTVMRIPVLGMPDLHVVRNASRMLLRG